MNYVILFSSYDYVDEYCWAGAWLYLATQNEHYLKVAEKNYEGGAAWGQSWDEKNSGCMVSKIRIICRVTGGRNYVLNDEDFSLY